MARTLADQNLTYEILLDLLTWNLALFIVNRAYAFDRYPVVPDTYKGSSLCS